MSKKIIFTTLAAVALLLGLAFVKESSVQPEVATVNNHAHGLTEMYRNDECTDTRAAECAVFVASVIEACATAMETGGADIIADIRCARARKLITTKKDCIPCLCDEVKKRGWDWVECPKAI